jgi:hypothetical protein
VKLSIVAMLSGEIRKELIVHLHIWVCHFIKLASYENSGVRQGSRRRKTECAMFSAVRLSLYSVCDLPAFTAQSENPGVVLQRNLGQSDGREPMTDRLNGAKPESAAVENSVQSTRLFLEPSHAGVFGLRLFYNEWYRSSGFRVYLRKLNQAVAQPSQG